MVRVAHWRARIKPGVAKICRKPSHYNRCVVLGHFCRARTTRAQTPTFFLVAQHGSSTRLYWENLLQQFSLFLDSHHQSTRYVEISRRFGNPALLGRCLVFVAGEGNRGTRIWERLRFEGHRFLILCPSFCNPVDTPLLFSTERQNPRQPIAEGTLLAPGAARG